MNAKISVFVICVEVARYLLLYILHNCTFNSFSLKRKHLILIMILCRVYLKYQGKYILQSLGRQYNLKASTPS